MRSIYYVMIYLLLNISCCQAMLKEKGLLGKFEDHNFAVEFITQKDGLVTIQCRHKKTGKLSTAVTQYGGLERALLPTSPQGQPKLTMFSKSDPNKP